MRTVLMPLVVLLFNCALIPKSYVKTPDYLKSKITNSSLTVFIDKSRIRMPITKNVLKVFGDNNQVDKYYDLLYSQLPYRYASETSLSRVFVTSDIDNALLSSRALSYGKHSFSIPLPPEGTTIKDIETDFILFLGNIEVRSVMETIVGSNPIRYLNTECYYAYYDNKNGKLASYGFMKAESPLSTFGGSGKSKENIITTFVFYSLKGSPLK